MTAPRPVRAPRGFLAAEGTALGLMLLVAGGVADEGLLFSLVAIGGVGVAAGAAILWRFSILKWGTKRGLAHRKERKELTKLNEKLERVEAERRDGNPDTGTTRT